MNNTTDGNTIITNLKAAVEGQIAELQQISSSVQAIPDADALEKLETDLHAKAIKLADLISALQLQKMLSGGELDEAEKTLVKSSPKKMKNMGTRIINLRMLGGTVVAITATYYHQKSDTKSRSGKGFYPKLLLLGTSDRCTPALCSRAALFATAACSLKEAQQLMNVLFGFYLDIKTIRMICKRFAVRARAAFNNDGTPIKEEFKGKRVIISADGGRVRVRKNKRGKKTKKNRGRYKTDWREPKLILVYVVNENGEKDRKIQPVIDASLDGPDAVFAVLLYYLKKLGVAAADQLLFVSDGAVWIWDRIAKLISDLGVELTQCLLVLDFYHAVEHLTSFATQKKWTKSEAKRWVNKQRGRLLNGKLDIFIQEIEAQSAKSKNKLLAREREYFKTHLTHMRYKEIKDKKLPIGSGGVESAIRRVINLRLKGPGIFWHEDSVDAMLLLRSYYKAGRWNLLEKMAVNGGLIVD